MSHTSTPRVHAFQPDALADLDAVALAQALRKRQVSALEVTEAAIDRIEQVNPALNAMALRTFAQARRWQDPTEGRGAFAGVPTLLKDTVDLRGHPTQLGTRVFRAAPARRDDPFVRQFLAQGFNVLGKTQLPEFGFNGTTEYQDGSATANPWQTAYSSGGSSGGAAALVAAGAVPIAHGNDGGGSIRIPAAACGLVGLKVTRNRLVNATLSRTLPLNLITEGVLTRSVRDTATFLAEAEKTHHHRSLPRVGLVEGPGSRKLRIGLWTTPPSGGALDTDTQAAVMRAARLLEGAGHHVEPIQARLSQAHIDSFLLYWGLLSFSVGRFGRVMFRGTDWDMRQYEGLSRALMHTFQQGWYRMPSAAMALLSAQRWNATHLAPFDAVLSPVLTHATPPLGYLNPAIAPEALLPRLIEYVAFTPLQNALGTPAVSVPMGLTQTDPRPVGVQLSAQAGLEGLLLSLAYELEAQAVMPQIAHPSRRGGSTWAEGIKS
jgi:amidase